MRCWRHNHESRQPYSLSRKVCDVDGERLTWQDFHEDPGSHGTSAFSPTYMVLNHHEPCTASTSRPRCERIGGHCDLKRYTTQIEFLYLGLAVGCRMYVKVFSFGTISLTFAFFVIVAIGENATERFFTGKRIFPRCSNRCTTFQVRSQQRDFRLLQIRQARIGRSCEQRVARFPQQILSRSSHSAAVAI